MTLEIRYIAVIIAMSLTFNINAALKFEGAADDVVEISPSASTGLEKVYVVKDAEGLRISYDGATRVKWSKFASQGAAYATDLGYSSDIELSNDDCGYIAEVGGRSYYYWIVNYANHKLELESVEESSDNSDCSNTLLDLHGSGDRIVYYTINGRSMELDRAITISYYTLTYDADASVYRQTETVSTQAYVHSPIVVPASLCDTKFVVSGDRFLKLWNSEQTIETDVIAARAVSAETSAVQNRREVDNEQSSDVSELGGSAPCEVEFTAAVTDAAVFYEWQLSKDSEFDVIEDRYSQTELNFTFRDQGTTYVRFFAADAAGVCEYAGPVYTVSIGASSLLCPNAFTPDSSPGVNDEWKVSYKSIIDFECHIFNRWGTELFSFTDPSIGWDGKYKGKYVPAGTYYYVIKAHGADGREYKLSGDINIIKSKDRYNSSDDTLE